MDPEILSHKPYVAFRRKVRSFIDTHIAPYSLGWERRRMFPDHLLQRCAENNLVGLSLPTTLGGQGKDYWHDVILAEELARGKTMGWALTLFVHNNLALPLFAELADSEEKKRILAGAAKGEYFLALALTEPGAGSDLLATETTARLTGQTYEISGEKKFITNGSVAKYIIVLAQVGEKKGMSSLGLFLLPADTTGIKRERLPTVGFKTGDTATIEFKQCAIPQDYLLGAPGRGFFHVLRALQRERLTAAVGVNAISLLALEETIAMLQKKQRFGEPLSKKQTIRHTIATLRAEIEASRQLAYTTCAAYIAGQSVDKEILMLKILAYTTAQKVLRECIHLHGGDGFLETNWLVHAYHDSQAFTIAAGTTEIIRDMLAGTLRL